MPARRMATVFCDDQVRVRNRHRHRLPKPIQDRMMELYQILASYDEEIDIILENIHWVAMLGAVARLFEALDSYNTFSEILSKPFRRSARRIVYHSRGPFSMTRSGRGLGGLEVVTFFMHCYEHCNDQLGLADNRRLPSLADRINVSDRTQRSFREVFEVAWNASDRVAASEVLSLAVPRLSSNEAKFLKTIEMLRAVPTCFASAGNDAAQEHFDVIVGSYIGTEIAWLSCDASSIRRGIARNDLRGLPKAEIQRLVQRFEKYIGVGRNYRHNNMALQVLLEKYLTTTSPE